MIRWNSKTRSLILTVPRWADLRNGRYRTLIKIGLAILALDFLISVVDLPLAEAMRNIDPAAEAFFRRIAKLGDSRNYLTPIIMLIPFLIAARQASLDQSWRRMLAWGTQALAFVFAAIAASGLFVQVAKTLIGRTRPRLWFQEGEYGFAPMTFMDNLYHSFPSGHACTIFALVVALLCFFPRLRWPLLLTAAFIAFGRVVITAHYLSDIVVGAFIGAFFALWLRRVFADRGWVFIRQRGVYRVKAPGVLAAQKMQAWLHETWGWRWGARGRLP